MGIILIFIDGFGLSEPVITNPYFFAATPFLDNYLEGHHFYASSMPLFSNSVTAKAVDAQLGVEGIPQSATGQTAIWTGVNAQKRLGYHLHGLPNPQLKSIIIEHNIYRRLKALGKSVIFANAYRPSFFSSNDSYVSVSTFAAVSAGLRLCTVDDLKMGTAVYQDITNKALQRTVEDVPLVSPTAAGKNLGKISLRFDLTVFEFFQTDIVGHKRDFIKALEIWTILDKFFEGLLTTIDLAENLVIIISDHGNMEDLSHSRHTSNLVPLLGIGYRHQALRGISNISQITPLIEEMHRRNDFNEIKGNLSASC